VAVSLAIYEISSVKVFNGVTLKFGLQKSKLQLLIKEKNLTKCVNNKNKP